MRLAALLFACALGASAQEVRVERRLLVKEKHLFASLGAAWLDRSDYFVSPGAALSVAYYPIESGGPEVRFVKLFSSLSSSARTVFDAFGMTPDVQRPVSLALVGWRQSLTYGKVAIAGSAVHFDVQAALHGGALFTDRATAPAVEGSLGVLVRVSQRVFAQFDLGVATTFEQRAFSGAAAGFLPILSVGAEL
jgi:hypothetical protein